MRELLHPEIDTEQFIRTDVPQEDITLDDLLLVFPKGSLTIEDLKDYRKSQAAKEDERARDRDPGKTVRTVVDLTPNITTRNTFDSLSTSHYQTIFIGRILNEAQAFRKTQSESGNGTHST